MGIGESKQYLRESDLSDDESMDSDSEHREIGQPVDMETVDAIAPLYTENQQIDLSSLRGVETDHLLDEPDIVGLVFLLYDERHQALALLKSYLLSKKNSGLLSKWASSQIEQGNANWHKLLVEALTIVQNYKILRNLGFDKSTLQSTYLPWRSETTCGIDRLRKTLYLVAEKLTGTETSMVVSFMRDVLLAKGISVAFSHVSYLELYFLLWECNQIDFKHLQKELKRLELGNSASEIEAALPTPSNVANLPVVNVRPQVHNRDRKTSTVRDNILQPGAFEEYLYGSNLMTNTNPSSRDSNVSNDSDRYDIDPNHPGVVLIINQESFYTEPDPQYRHLLHENNDYMLLEERKGTRQDKERLKRCFSNMNFKVFVQDNVPHYQILKSIEGVTDSVSLESSLIVCILSHGEKGVIYGANSCKVEVGRIENIMCRRNQNLHGKPKVLILQSCQGKYCQKIEEEIQTDGPDDGNTTDGPSRGPATTDLLTFWATIPGFAAVRNLKTGSWFIQSLCDEIEQSRNQVHFLDICTKALRKVSKQVWKEPSGTNVMVPMGVFTLTKSFYLPPFKNS